jgi:hypothetical protein
MNYGGSLLNSLMARRRGRDINPRPAKRPRPTVEEVSSNDERGPPLRGEPSVSHVDEESEAGHAAAAATAPRGPRIALDSMDEGGGGGGEADLVPLDALADQARTELIDRLMASGDNRTVRGHTCFFCVMRARYEAMEQRAAGQRNFMMEETYAYATMIRWHSDNVALPEYEKAVGLDSLYRLHVWDPAKEALGGRNPPGWPEPSVRSMLEHIKFYNNDRVAAYLEAIEKTREVMYAFSAQAKKDGSLSWHSGRTILSAAAQLATLTDKMAAMQDTGRAPVGPFVFDPQKVMAFADSRPLDAFRLQATTGLGGATATNTDDDTARVAVQRAHFGALSPSRVEDDEGGEDE